jgi:hypothetical protein
MPGILVTNVEVARNGVDDVCDGVKRRRNMAFLLGYCNRAGVHDGNPSTVEPACSYKPCEKHTRMLATARCAPAAGAHLAAPTAEQELRALNDSIVQLHGGASQFELDELPHVALDDREALVAAVQRARHRLRAAAREEEYLLNIAAMNGSLALAEACTARIDAHVATLRDAKYSGDDSVWRGSRPWLEERWGRDPSAQAPEIVQSSFHDQGGKSCHASSLDPPATDEL